MCPQLATTEEENEDEAALCVAISILHYELHVIHSLPTQETCSRQ
jgi:hypothetical protein